MRVKINRCVKVRMIVRVKKRERVRIWVKRVGETEGKGVGEDMGEGEDQGKGESGYEGESEGKGRG